MNYYVLPIIENCIFAGANNGQTVNAYRSNYGSGVSVPTFERGNYKTTDLIENTNANQTFTGITEVPYSATELFVDPVNGNFRIKSGGDFKGKGVAGDPIWW